MASVSDAGVANVWPAHPAETQRLAALHDLRRLDPDSITGDATALLDSLTEFGAQHFGVPFCCISLIHEQEQHLLGINDAFSSVPRVTPRGCSFCTHGILPDAGDVFVVQDTTKDQRFADLPMVTGEPHVRFYAGAPLCHSGQRVGMLAILDAEPRDLSAEESGQLKAAAAVVMGYLEQLIASPESFEMPSADAAFARLAASIAASPLLSAAHSRPSMVKCLGWRSIHMGAEPLIALLCDACAHLKLRTTGFEDGLGFRVERSDASAVAVAVSVWAGDEGGMCDVQVRRLQGDSFTYHELLRQLQAQLLQRLPKSAADSITLIRA